MTDKTADLAGPGIGTYAEVDRALPRGYHSALTPMETMRALFAVKDFIEDGLCRELNLQMVQVPLIVTRQSGINDMLDRDGSRTPVEFPCGLGIDPRLDAQVVQAATKWKRTALAQFGCGVGEGICTDMRAIRKDYFLDHDHSAYVDQWDWERVITSKDRTLSFLRDVVGRIWKVIHGAGVMAAEAYPQLADRLPGDPRDPRVHPRRGHPRDVPGPAPQGAGDPPAPGVRSGGVHRRDRLSARRRLSPRAACRRLRRLDHRHHR